MSDPPPSSAYSGFFQTPPALRNPYTQDPLLQRILRRRLPASLLTQLTPTFTALATESLSPEKRSYLDDTRHILPQVIVWDGWGKRKDELRTPEGWRKLKEFWAESGMMEDMYTRAYGTNSRYYVIAASLGGTTCPLAMTDGAARCLEVHGPKEIRELVIPKLLSRSADEFWTSGQWMTERTGGSDISATETRAYPEGDGTFTVKGFKWFSSATDADMTLLLAKTPGHDKVTLFWARVKNDDGTLNGVRIIRLKDKFGTKSIPTAELELTGMRGAVIVGKEGEGVKAISEVLNITRVHCALGCITTMRRAFDIVTDYATKRKVFGKLLSDNPLHLRTLSALAVQLRVLTHFTFFIVTLLGKSEIPGSASQDDILLLRLLTPVLKATTAKLGVQFLSESMEALGGQGYVEEGGIAALYRDIQVNAIWEGTTNVLAHDMLRVLRGRTGAQTLGSLDRYVARCVAEGESCGKMGGFPGRLGGVYGKWRGRLVGSGEGVVEAHARELVLWLGRTVGTMEMMVDAASDGDEIEIECCKRVFDGKNLGWEDDARETAEWDRRIVFGGGERPVAMPVQARL